VLGTLRSHHRRSFVVLTALLGLLAMALLSGCSAEVNAEIQTYAGINAIRAQRGLPPLQSDARLVEIARMRSRDMASRNYFSHNPPNGCNFVCLMDANGVPHSWAGENIAWNNWGWAETAKKAVEMWRNSPPHMENILNCHYTKFGTGVAKSADGKIYYTMLFEGNGNC
jgi:uncharacterized protein YkwD